ncbi:MAG: Hsp70 family protein [Myxococcota bacterium]|nr:Hsp70 family protein [Myxococcota bacterium]
MREPVIGIDLGTTYSATATVEDGAPRVIPSRRGGRLTPSMVGFTHGGDRVVGEAARTLAEELPENVAFATKRFIGRRWSPELAAQAKYLVPYPLIAGPQGEIRIKVAGQVLPITQISAMVLGELKLDAQAYYGRPVHKAVITVPANFDDGQRQGTKEAAAIAGLEVLRIVNEPTAAAVAYGLTQKFEGRALVFDLGGGTFDVSILEVQNGVFEVKATGGDPQLGGEDFDNRIVQWLLAQIPDDRREEIRTDPVSMQRLKLAAERSKRELTLAEEAYISINDLGSHLRGGKPHIEINTALTRSFFENISDPLSRRCLEVCAQVMSDARLDPNDPTAIDQVLLVGGMTRVPLVRRLVEDYFHKPPNISMNPDEVVALGAAVHASELADQGGAALLIDVASHSLGVGVLGNKTRRLISKNTAIPVVAKEVFVPGKHGQTEARIPIFQGESEYCDENTKLGEVVLKDLHTTARADTPLEVTFEMTSEGTLTVRAVDTTTGAEQAVRIEARTELTPGEVDKLKREQGQYAKGQEKKDEKSGEENFKRLLERGEKLARILERSATENPSQDAQAAVATVRSLLDLGRAAMKGQNPEQMAEVTRRFNQLLTAGR